MILFASVAFYLVYEDIERNGDARGLSAEMQPTTKSMQLGAGICLIIVVFAAGVLGLVQVYRRKRIKPDDN